jgi:hypothetical protein
LREGSVESNPFRLAVGKEDYKRFANPRSKDLSFAPCRLARQVQQFGSQPESMP